MFSPVRAFIPKWDFDKSKPVVIFEAPHASNYVPSGYPVPENFAEVDDHERWDPGATELMEALKKQFPYAKFVESEITRMIDNHNRAEDYCCQPGITEKERQHILITAHRPYINTVYGLINETIANGQFPILFNIHTLEPVLNGYERKLFSIGGNPDSEVVKALYGHLKAQLSESGLGQQLGLSENQLLDEINKPFDFTADDTRQQNMAARYALNYGFPWVHLETRNNFARHPAVQRVYVAAYDAVLSDPAVSADWHTRRDKYFEAISERLLRPVAPGPMAQPAALVL